MAGSMVVWQGGDSHRPVHTIGGQSQPGTTVASGSEDGTIKLRDLASGKLLRTIAPQHKGVCSLAWIPTESAENAVSSGWIASGMGDNAIVLSDIASGKHVTTMHGHTGAVHSLLWLNAKGWLVSGSADATVRLWRVR